VETEKRNEKKNIRLKKNKTKQKQERKE
jgi:hypothetical protein